MSYVDASQLRPQRDSLVSRRKVPAFRADEDLLEGGSTREEIDLRQLRHHTKNSLQRILAIIADTPALCATPDGERMVRELGERISLSTDISDALFGLTTEPGPMVERLRKLAGAVTEMTRSPNQVIRIGVSVRGTCPPRLREAVLRAAHELIGNAVKHGMKGRPQGRIAVRMVSGDHRTTLTVTDNGWGFAGLPRTGEGLSLAQEFAHRHGGKLTLDGEDGTIATLELPH